MSSLQSFKDSIQGLVTEPHDPDYSLRRWAANAERPAKLVVYPKSAEDVSKTIRFARAENLEIAVRSGGHAPAGTSSAAGGLVIDLSKFMNTVRIDAENKLAYAEGGAIWATVDSKAHEHGLATVATIINHVGVGGSSTGGGMGWLSGEHGLVIDNIASATVVVASGEILKASPSENSDLFWGIRGAGSNFGVVTEFVYKLHPQRQDVYTSFLFFAPDSLGRVAEETKSWLKERSAKEPGGIVFVVGPTGQPVFGFLGIYNGESEEGKAKYQRFVDIGPVMDDSKSMPYPALNALNNDLVEYGGNYVVRGVFVKGVDPDVLVKVYGRWHEIVTQEPEFIRSLVSIELFPFEKIASIAKDATPYLDRDPVYNVGVVMRWTEGDLQARALKHARELENMLLGTQAEDKSAVRGYANYNDDDAVAPMEENKAREQFGSNYERLQQVKRQYDPENVFHKWFPITPASA